MNQLAKILLSVFAALILASAAWFYGVWNPDETVWVATASPQDLDEIGRILTAAHIGAVIRSTRVLTIEVSRRDAMYARLVLSHEAHRLKVPPRISDSLR